MKKIIIVLLFGLLISCDPGYSIYVANRSQDNIYVETNRAIESRLLANEGPFYDSIVSKKINSSDKNALYKLDKNTNIFLFSYIGAPNSNYFPFENLKIIKGSDTIRVDKSNFMQKLTKGKKSNYFIDID